MYHEFVRNDYSWKFVDDLWKFVFIKGKQIYRKSKANQYLCEICGRFVSRKKESDFLVVLLKARATYLKQVVHHHLALHDSGMEAPNHTVCGHHRRDQTFPRLGLCPEDGHAVAQLFLVFFRDGVGRFRKFHLTQVDDPVGPFDDEVDLCAACCFVALPPP